LRRAADYSAVFDTMNGSRAMDAAICHALHDTAADPRWAAVVARDAAVDGHFVYAVKTTGVFCRPSCAARTPKPENVSFHLSPADARAAGFRPCLRCRPEEPPLAARHAATVAAACRLIDAGDPPPTLEALARHAGLSVFHLHRVFKAVTGLTPQAWARARRAERLREGLARGASVTGALLDAGYGSPAASTNTPTTHWA
jgi:AraC family transcriptional regulator of adaptative response/methylated-DNA-[protein]-cysteine methyltransferase